MKKSVKNNLLILLILVFQIINIVPIRVYASERKVNNIYFLDSKAKDNGDGTSEAKAWNSLKQVNKHVFQPGDRLLIKKGSVFNGTLYPKGSGAEGSPIIIDVYGDGDVKPRINAGGKSFIAQQKDWEGPFVNFYDESTIGAAIYLYNQEYWEINNISVTNTSNNINEADRSGIRIEGYDYGIINHIYIRNCEVSNVKGFNGQDDIYPVIPTRDDGTPMFPDLTDPGINPNDSKIFSGARTTHRTGGINLVTYTARLPECENDKGVVEQPLDTSKKITVFNDVKIENNIISNCSANGITTTNVKGTLDNDEFRHTNVVIRNNKIDHVTRSGIITLYTSGVLVEKNIIDNFQSTNLGYGCGIWADRANDMVYQYNEVKNGQNYMDGMAFNLDDMTRNGVIQYNYTHDNVGGGYMLHVRPKSYNRNHTIRYNISVNDSGRFSDHVAQIVAVGEDKDPETQIENAKVYNNTFISNKDVHPVFKGNEVSYTNNIWYFTNSNLAARENPFDFGENSTFNNNVYYGVNQPKRDGKAIDNNAKFINPLFMKDDLFSISREEVLQGVKLQRDSQLIGSGVRIENDGGLDFFGYNTNKENINIGAYSGLGHEGLNESYSIVGTSSEVKKYLSDGSLQTEIVNETPTEANSKWVNTTFNQDPVVYTKAKDAYVKLEWNGTGITPILKSGPGAGEIIIEVYRSENLENPVKRIEKNTYSEIPGLIEVNEFENMFEENTDCVIILKNVSTSQKASNLIKFNISVNQNLSDNCKVDKLENVFINDGKYTISYYEDNVNIPLSSSYAVDSCKELTEEVVTTYKVIDGEGTITDNILTVNTPGTILVEVTLEYKEQVAKAQAKYVVNKAAKPQVNDKPIYPSLPKAGIYESEDREVSKSGQFTVLESDSATKGAQLKTDKKNDSMSLAFYGNKVSIYGRKAVGTGILNVEVYSLIDGEETLIESKEIDTYKANMEDRALLYEIEFEENNSYKIKVINTGKQNVNGNNSHNMIIDYFVVDEKIEASVNKDELISVVKQAEAINLEDYTQESTAILIKLIEEAKELLEDQTASQEQVDKLVAEIVKAIDNLIVNDGNEEVDKTKIIELVENIRSLDKNQYVPSTWRVVETELENAIKVIEDENVSKEDVLNAYDKLMDAVLKLKLKPNNKKLKELIEKVEKLDSSKYTKESWSILEKELLNAKEIIENDEATSEEIERAEKGLSTAIKSLVKVELVNAENNNNNEDINGNKLPETGDDAMVVYGILAFMLVLIGGGLVLTRGKKGYQ